MILSSLRHKPAALLLAISGAALFLSIGVERLWHYRAQQRLLSGRVGLAADIARGDRMEDPREALMHYLAIRPETAGVRVRILRRQWDLALRKIDRLRRAGRHPVMAESRPEFYDDLVRHVAEMAARCEGAIGAEEPPPPGLAWRLHNIRGMTAVMRAYLVLFEEKNEKKAAAALTAAVDSFKEAIRLADQSDAPEYQTNIPRLNLELVHGQERLRKILLSRMDAGARLEARENLGAMIPESGGYAAGDPTGDRLKK